MKASILVQRLHLIVVPASNYPSTPMKRLTFLAELAQLGYTVSQTEAWNDSVLQNYEEIVATLQQMRGANVEYVPLFQGFPDHCPEETAYQAKRLISIFLGIATGEIREETGYLLPSHLEQALFNLEEFGANPVSQTQDEYLYRLGVERQQQRQEDRQIHWLKLKLVHQDTAKKQLQAWVLQNLYARSSIKEELREDIAWVLNYFALQGEPIPVEAERLVFKENQTFLTQFYWQRGLYTEATQYLLTPTDCLRLLASLTASDVSLSKPIRFPKLNRPQRRAILAFLERCPDLAANLRKYQGLWIVLGNYLHPGEWQKTYPKTAQAFEQLRHGKIVTFESLLEKALTRSDWPEIRDLLRSRPGVFARRLHQVLTLAEDKEIPEILEEFSQIAQSIPLKNLLVMERYFATIDSTCWRAIVNKSGRLRVLENNPDRTSPELNAQVVALLQGAIRTVIARNYDSWQGKTIWMDPSLNKYVLPLSERKASQGTLALARGSRIPLSDLHVLRLFVYWQQTQERTDLDLSVQMLDEKFNCRDYVSYTALQNTGIQHSGDIQSAPYGASEFIDIRLERLKRQWRYIAMIVFRFAGEQFADMTCHCGWMVRDRFDSGTKTFDAKTVQSKVDLNGQGGYCIPLLVDLANREIIYTDLYVSGAWQFNRVEEAGKNLPMIVEQIAGFTETRPNFADLALAHIRARGGTQVESQEEAEITFGLEDCTYTINDTAKILSELL